MAFTGIVEILREKRKFDKMEEKFDYVIVSEHNEWLSTGKKETRKQLEDEIARLKSEDSTRELTVFQAKVLEMKTF